MHVLAGIDLGGMLTLTWTLTWLLTLMLTWETP